MEKTNPIKVIIKFNNLKKEFYSRNKIVLMQYAFNKTFTFMFAFLTFFEDIFNLYLNY